MVVKINDFEIEIFHIEERPGGHGAYSILTHCEYRGQRKKFKVITNDMPSIDEARDMIGEQKKKKLLSIAETKLSAKLIFWTEEVNEQLNEEL